MTLIQLFHPFAAAPSFVYRVAVAVGAVLTALLLRILLSTVIGQSDGPFLFFLTAIGVSSWYGGLGSGLLAMVLSALLADYYFLTPERMFTVSDTAQARGLVMFALEGAIVTGLSFLTKRLYQRLQVQVNERRKAEAALAESEERFRLLVDRVQDYAIFMLDPHGMISTWNAGAERIKGYKAGEIIGKPYETLFTPEDVAAGKPGRLLAEARRSGHAEDEGWRIRKDGSRFWASVVITLLRNERGEIRGYSKVTRDLTEQRKAEEAMIALQREREARAEAEKADALKLQFLAMISHELRTPLTSIKGFTSTLLADDIQWSPEEVNEFVRIMDIEADKLTALIEQLLHVSQIQAGMFTIHQTAQPLQASVDVALPDLQRLTAQRLFEIKLPALPDVMIDCERIAQVLVNLVDNAVKYSPEGTAIQIEAVQADDMVRVYVCNHGAPISVEDRETVFQAFRQLERKSGGRRGAGLGLAIVRGIVEGHGGRVWIEDFEGWETTFAFSIPVAEKVEANAGERETGRRIVEG